MNNLPAFLVYYAMAVTLLFWISGTVTRKLSNKNPEAWKNFLFIPKLLDIFCFIMAIVSLVLYFLTR